MVLAARVSPRTFRGFVLLVLLSVDAQASEPNPSLSPAPSAPGALQLTPTPPYRHHLHSHGVSSAVSGSICNGPACAGHAGGGICHPCAIAPAAAANVAARQHLLLHAECMRRHLQWLGIVSVPGLLLPAAPRACSPPRPDAKALQEKARDRPEHAPAAASDARAAPAQGPGLEGADGHDPVPAGAAQRNADDELVRRPRAPRQSVPACMQSVYVQLYPIAPTG